MLFGLLKHATTSIIYLHEKAYIVDVFMSYSCYHSLVAALCGNNMTISDEWAYAFQLFNVPEII